MTVLRWRQAGNSTPPGPLNPSTFQMLTVAAPTPATFSTAASLRLSGKGMELVSAHVLHEIEVQGFVGAVLGPPKLRARPAALVAVGGKTVERHEHDSVDEALVHDFLVHGIGIGAAARMADDEDPVRLGRLDCGDRLVFLFLLAPEEGVEVDVPLLPLGGGHPNVHLGLRGVETAEEKDRLV